MQHYIFLPYMILLKWYYQFVLEERFGFNKMTLKLFVTGTIFLFFSHYILEFSQLTHTHNFFFSDTVKRELSPGMVAKACLLAMGLQIIDLVCE